MCYCFCSISNHCIGIRNTNYTECWTVGENIESIYAFILHVLAHAKLSKMSLILNGDLMVRFLFYFKVYWKTSSQNRRNAFFCVISDKYLILIIGLNKISHLILELNWVTSILCESGLHCKNCFSCVGASQSNK